MLCSFRADAFKLYLNFMELRHLRYFVTVAEELNVSRASARLRISQPAVSRQLHDLEEELGVALFVREKNGLSLTQAGESYLGYAYDILRKSAEAITHMNSFRKLPVKKLIIGYIAPVLASLLTPALKKMSQKNKQIEVLLKELSPKDQIKALREKRIDLAFLGNPYPEIRNEFELKTLKKIPLQAVLPDDHPLANRKRIGLIELKNEIFIGFDEEYFPGRNVTLCQACQQVGFTPRLRHRVENLSALLATVAEGKGVTLAPEEVSQLPHPQAVLIPLKPPVPSVVSAAAFRKNEKNEEVMELLTWCRAINH